MTLPPLPPALDLARIALFFDVDGTLVEIERDPKAVKVPDGLRDLVDALIKGTGGAFALVSGRPIAQLDELFAPLIFCASGLHGLERRLLPGGIARVQLDSALLAQARERLHDFVRHHPGTFAEDKGLTLALHYRNGPHHYEAASTMVRELVEASGDRLVLLEGKMVFELKPPGYDKGRAIADFMKEPPFQGRCPVFAGDDVTDEAGFEIINAADGISIKVGDDSRPTLANHRQPDVTAMKAWLTDIAGLEPTR